MPASSSPQALRETSSCILIVLGVPLFFEQELSEGKESAVFVLSSMDTGHSADEWVNGVIPQGGLPERKGGPLW